MPIQLLFVLATAALFLASLVVNTYLFKELLEHAPGIAWVYLPAGIRLLCTLLFGGFGAIGLTMASIGVSVFYFFPNDLERALVGGLIGGLAPYLVYRWACRRWVFGISLRNLTPAHLLVLSVACAAASPLLHHIYFAWRGQGDLLLGFLAMFVGDLAGILLVLYSIKAVMALWPRGGDKAHVAVSRRSTEGSK